MSGVLILRETEPRRILQVVLNDKIPVVISYMSQGRWHLARAVLSDVGQEKFTVRVSPQKRTNPIVLSPMQSVGISFKYGFEEGYGRFVFGTVVTDVEQPRPAAGVVEPLSDDIGTVTLSLPEEIEVVQRRSYIRVRVPQGLDVDVVLCCRSMQRPCGSALTAEVSQSWHGKLVDISAGGLAVAVKMSEGPSVPIGQSFCLRFTPLPNETPLVFNTFVKNISQTADGEGVCIGLEMIGLEATPEGRLILQRLCNVVDEYDKKNNRNKIKGTDNSIKS